MSLVSDSKLSPEVIDDLRRRFPYHQDEGWVIDRARHPGGWVDANRGFLEWHRDRGEAEMLALIAALGIPKAEAPLHATELIELAYDVFMPPDEYRGTIVKLDDNHLRIVIGVCPMYGKIERQEWHGVTACGSWHHRRGWYDAIGINPADTLVAEQKWGDAACVAEVEF